jgi:hypothetical protein
MPSNRSAVRQQMIRQRTKAAEVTMKKSDAERVDEVVRLATERIKADLEAGLDETIDARIDLKQRG